jgi:hypothetical protein
VIVPKATAGDAKVLTVIAVLGELSTPVVVFF